MLNIQPIILKGSWVQLEPLAVMFSLIITFIVAALFIAFPKFLASLYLNIHDPVNTDTLQIIVVLFAILSVQQIFDGVRNVLTGSLRGLFDTKFPMTIGLIVIWLIGIPSGYFLAFDFHMGVYGIVMGSTVGFLVGMLILFYRWQSIRLAP